jgi:hypothetical protein
VRVSAAGDRSTITQGNIVDEQAPALDRIQRLQETGRNRRIGCIRLHHAGMTIGTAPSRLKEFRRVATRCGKLAADFASAALALAAVIAFRCRTSAHARPNRRRGPDAAVS